MDELIKRGTTPDAPQVGGRLPLHPGLCDRGAGAGLQGGQRRHGDRLLEDRQVDL